MTHTYTDFKIILTANKFFSFFHRRLYLSAFWQSVWKVKIRFFPFHSIIHLFDFFLLIFRFTAERISACFGRWYCATAFGHRWKSLCAVTSNKRLHLLRLFFLFSSVFALNSTKWREIFTKYSSQQSNKRSVQFNLYHNVMNRKTVWPIKFEWEE